MSKKKKVFVKKKNAEFIRCPEHVKFAPETEVVLIQCSPQGVPLPNRNHVRLSWKEFSKTYK